MPIDEGDWFIIDTDCGTDDAMAIMLALHRHASRILAITCCCGNTTVHNACSNVMRVLTVCGHKNIPVYSGCSRPLTRPFEQGIDDIHGSDGFGNCSQRYSTGGMQVSVGPASWNLVQLARKYPKRITVVTLAPLTNIALAHRLDPEFTDLLKAIVCMGGTYTGVGNVTETAEYNFYCDPESANIVFSEARCSLVLVPLETTLEYGIEWDDYDALMATSTTKGRFLKDVLNVVAEFCRKDNYPIFNDCDFLAAVAAFYPDSISDTIQHPVVVECEGERTRGMAICCRTTTEEDNKKNKATIVRHFKRSLIDQLRKDMLADS